MVGDDIDGYAEGEEPLVFHYKKGDFRKLESEDVRNRATGQNQPKMGFFSVLVNTKGNRMIFISMVFCFALCFIVWIFNSRENTDTINGISCELNAFSFDGQVYASLEVKKSGKDKDVLPQNLEVVFEAWDTDGALSNREESVCLFNPEDGSQFVRVVFTDYNLYNIKCTVKSSSGEGQISLSSRIVQR